MSCNPFVSFSALSAIIAFLTDSLIPFVHPILLHSLRINLYAYLPMHLSSTATTLVFPDCLPATIVPLTVWLTAFGSQRITIHVSSTAVRAVFANGRNATLWALDDEADLKEGSKIPAIAGRAKLDMEEYINAPIRVPSPPIRAASPSSSSDSESDSDDGYFSESSMTSVSSTTSVGSSTKSTVIRPAAAPAAKSTTYLYQGGKTNVVTGGIMLSSSTRTPAHAPAVPRVLPAQRGPSFGADDTPYVPPKMRTQWKRSRSILLGPDTSDNWRRRN